MFLQQRRHNNDIKTRIKSEQEHFDWSIRFSTSSTVPLFHWYMNEWMKINQSLKFTTQMIGSNKNDVIRDFKITKENVSRITSKRKVWLTVFDLIMPREAGWLLTGNSIARSIFLCPFVCKAKQLSANKQTKANTYTIKTKDRDQCRGIR